MAKRISFIPRKTPTGTWRLNVPAKLTDSGKRERHFFRTRELAFAAAATLKDNAKKFGERTHSIPPSLAEMATAAASLLAPWNASLLDAVKHFIAHRERETASRTLNAAADEWMASCDHLRGKTLCGYRQTSQKLKDALGGSMLSSITTEQLQAALTPKSTPPTAAASHIRRGKVFWNWSSKRGWCEARIADRLESPKGNGGTEIGILTVEEARALLQAAQDHFPQATASYALQLFAGIRAEEITRLEKDNVTVEGIELTAAVTKKGRRRHITPCPTLVAWLTAFPFAPCPNWKRIDVACRRMAGWQLESATLQDMERRGTVMAIPKITRGEWKQNCLRHSHASYSVAAGVPLETLLFEFGHSGTPAMLRQHYVGVASKKQAIEFFEILPPGAARPARLKVVKSNKNQHEEAPAKRRDIPLGTLNTPVAKAVAIQA